eukprot:1141914-Pelagomonas_calceolata.AAC.3
MYNRISEHEPCQLPPSGCKLDKRGGSLCAWLGVSAMRARVWAARGVEAKVLQTNPSFQDSDIV